MRRRHRAQREDPQQFVGHLGAVFQTRAVRMEQVRQDVPGTGGGERLLVPGRRGRQVIRPLADVVDDPRVNAAAPGPDQPVAGTAHQVDVHHPVDQRRRHRPHDGRILAPVPRPDHHGLRVQRVAAEPPVQDQAVERLLHLVARPVQLVEEQHVRLVPRDGLRRAEPAARPVPFPGDPRHADKILGRQLSAQQCAAFQPDLRGELLDQAGLADAWLPPNENRPYHRDVKEYFGQLRRGNGNRSVHTPPG